MSRKTRGRPGGAANGSLLRQKLRVVGGLWRVCNEIGFLTDVWVDPDRRRRRWTAHCPQIKMSSVF
jgi:hypothetical protein